MKLEQIMNLKNQLLNWNNDKDCTEIINCENCPLNTNKICERLQDICKEIEDASKVKIKKMQRL